MVDRTMSLHQGIVVLPLRRERHARFVRDGSQPGSLQLGTTSEPDALEALRRPLLVTAPDGSVVVGVLGHCLEGSPGRPTQPVKPSARLEQLDDLRAGIFEPWVVPLIYRDRQDTC